MVEKAEIMQGKKKKKEQSVEIKGKNASVCVKDRNTQRHPSCPTAVEPSISLHQREEACGRLYLF